MKLSALRKCAFVLPAAAVALALAGCKTEGGPEAPAKAQKAAWTPAAKVATAPAKAELPPGNVRTYAVGEKWVWKTLNGGELTRDVVAVKGSIVNIKDSSGCSYSLDMSGFAPVLKFGNCRGSSGSHDLQRTGDIFPLAIGNTENWAYAGRNDKGNTWSGVRSCKVVGTANVTVPAGSFDTYHVICREKDSRYDYYYSPEAGASVIHARAPAGGAKKGRRYHYELIRLEPPA